MNKLNNRPIASMSHQDYFSKNKLETENGGSQSHLDENQTAQLIAHLEGKIYLHAKTICAYVKEEFSVCYTISGMIKWLQKHASSTPNKIVVWMDKERIFVKLKK